MCYTFEEHAEFGRSVLNVVVQIRNSARHRNATVVRNKSIPVPGLHKPLLKRCAQTRNLTKIFTSFPSERQVF